jgi:hypothetical protein
MVLIGTVGCTSQPDTGHMQPSQQHSVRSTEPSALPDSYSGATKSGCDGTAVRRGDAPAWASGKNHGFTGQNQTPYAVSTRGLVVAYLWGYPLAVQHLGSKTDKILWFAEHTDGPLHIQAHPVGATRPVFSATVSAAGSDGMPSLVKVVRPGCWRFTLTWAGRDDTNYRDTISIRYAAHR